MVTGTQISIAIIVFVILILIIWNKSQQKLINKYNEQNEKKFQEIIKPFIYKLRAKGYSDQEIMKLVDVARKRAERDNMTPEERDINDLINNPGMFLKNKIN